jgi:hypothetical protein
LIGPRTFRLQKDMNIDTALRGITIILEFQAMVMLRVYVVSIIIWGNG